MIDENGKIGSFTVKNIFSPIQSDYSIGKLKGYKNTVLQLFADNSLQHEAPLMGVPLYYDWATSVKVSNWNTPPVGTIQLTAWGQFFYTTGTPVGNATVQIRNMRLYTHTANGWKYSQSGDITGADFEPTFSGANDPPVAFSQSDGVATVTTAYGMIFHFWPSVRATLPVGLDAMLVLVDIRCVDSDNMLFGSGADYWTATTNPDVGVGRIKKVTRDWTTYGFTTATLAQLMEFN